MFVGVLETMYGALSYIYIWDLKEQRGGKGVREVGINDIIWGYIGEKPQRGGVQLSKAGS